MADPVTTMVATETAKRAVPLLRRVLLPAIVVVIGFMLVFCGAIGGVLQQSTAGWPVPIPSPGQEANGWQAGGWQVTSGFGWRTPPVISDTADISGTIEFHPGADLAGGAFGMNAPVVSVFDGTVTYLGWDQPDAEAPDKAAGGQVVVVSNGADPTVPGSGDVRAVYAHVGNYILHVQLQARVGGSSFLPIGMLAPELDNIAIETVCDDDAVTFVGAKARQGTYQFAYDRASQCTTTVRWPEDWGADGPTSLTWETPIEEGMQAKDVALRFRATAPYAAPTPGEDGGAGNQPPAGSVQPGAGWAAAKAALGLSAGRETSPYGCRAGSLHAGQDIAITEGTPIYAIFGGKVVSGGFRPNLEGNYLIIQAPNGQRTYYGHMRDYPLFNVGQDVPEHAMIGRIGQTGLATGPHLHFMITAPGGGAWIDPVVYYDSGQIRSVSSSSCGAAITTVPMGNIAPDGAAARALGDTPATASDVRASVRLAQTNTGSTQTPAATARRCRTDTDGRRRCSATVGELPPTQPLPAPPTPAPVEAFTGSDVVTETTPFGDTGVYSDGTPLGRGAPDRGDTARIPDDAIPTGDAVYAPAPDASAAPSARPDASATPSPRVPVPQQRRWEPISAPAAPARVPGMAAPVAQVDEPLPTPLPSTAVSTPITGAPTITLDTLEQVLKRYNSPALPSASAFYDLGVQYGIDPAFLLAMFVKESGAGTDPAWVGIKNDGSTTHNVGNIRCFGYPTCYPNSNGFRDYPDWPAGIAAAYELLQRSYIGRGLTTVETVIPVWAPADDGNDTAAYILQVKTMMAQWRSGNVGGGPVVDTSAPCYVAAMYAMTKQGAIYSQGGYLAGDPIDPATGTYYPRTGPNSFDCSGLVWAAYKQSNITMGWTTHTQQYDGAQTGCTVHDLRGASTTCWAIGDTVLLARGGVPYHTALYVGNGLFMDCFNHAVDCVLHEVQGLSSYQHNFFMARRIVNGCGDHVDLGVPGQGAPQPRFVAGGPCVRGVPTFAQEIEYIDGCGPPVRVGTVVKMLDWRVAYVGMSGATTGPHLHFGIEEIGVSGPQETNVCTADYLQGRTPPPDAPCVTTMADPIDFLPRAHASTPSEVAAVATALPAPDEPFQLPPPGVPGALLQEPAGDTNVPDGDKPGEYWSPNTETGRFGGGETRSFLDELSCWFFGGCE